MLEKIEYRDDGVVLTFSGVVTSSELLDANSQIVEYLAQLPYRYQIFCFTDVSDFQLSADQMRQLAKQDLEAFAKNSVEKIAIVSKSKLIYGLARMYEAFAYDSSAETRIFEELHVAEQWIH